MGKGLTETGKMTNLGVGIHGAEDIGRHTDVMVVQCTAPTSAGQHVLIPVETADSRGVTPQSAHFSFHFHVPDLHLQEKQDQRKKSTTSPGEKSPKPWVKMKFEWSLEKNSYLSLTVSDREKIPSLKPGNARHVAFHVRGFRRVAVEELLDVGRFSIPQVQWRTQCHRE